MSPQVTQVTQVTTSLQSAPAFSLVPAAYVILVRKAPGTPDSASTLQPPEEGLSQPARAARSPHTQVLLQLRQATGYMDGHWACGAAGHLRPGESVVAAAAREAREETGAVLAEEDLQPLTTLHRSNDVRGPALEQRVDFFFTARRWTGQPRIREATRTAAMDWFPLNRLPSPVPPHELYVLRLLADALDDGTPVPAAATFGFAPGQSVAR